MHGRSAPLCAVILLTLVRAMHATRTRAKLQRGYESDLQNADASLQAELGVLSSGASSEASPGPMQDADPLVNVALAADPFEVGADHPDQPGVNAEALNAVPTSAPLGAQKLALWAASQGARESSLQSEVRSLTAQSSVLQSDMAKASVLKIQTNQTQAELEHLRQQMRPDNIAQLKHEADALEKRHTNLLMQLREKDGEILTLERDLKPLRAKVRAAQKEAADLKARSKKSSFTQAKLQAARAEEGRLRHTVDSLRKRLVALQGTRKLPKQTVIDAALARTENATALLETQNKMLHQQKFEAQKEADAQVVLLEAQVQRAEAHRAQLEDNLRVHKALVASAKKNLTLLVKEKQSLLRERADLRKRADGLGSVEARLRAKGAEVQRLRRQVALLDKSVSTTRSSLLFQDNARLEEKVRKMQKENADLTSKRQEEEKQGLAMEVELKNAKRAVVSLRRKVVMAETVRQHTAGVWRNVKKIDRENAALRRGIALLTQRLTRIREESTESHEENSDFQL